MGDSWKDEGERGGIIGTGADARVGIGDSKRRDRREEGWAAAETNGATLPRPSWLRASVMDDVFFFVSPHLVCRVRPSALTFSGGPRIPQRLGEGSVAAAAAQQGKKEKQDFFDFVFSAFPVV